MNDTSNDLSDDDIRDLLNMAREDVETARNEMRDAAKRLQEAQTTLNAFEALRRLRRESV